MHRKEGKWPVVISVSLLIGVTSSSPVLLRNSKTILRGHQVAVRANGFRLLLSIFGEGQVVTSGEAGPGNINVMERWALYVHTQYLTKSL